MFQSILKQTFFFFVFCIYTPVKTHTLFQIYTIKTTKYLYNSTNLIYILQVEKKFHHQNFWVDNAKYFVKSIYDTFDL